MTDPFQTFLLLLLALAGLYGIVVAAWRGGFDRIAHRLFRTRLTEDERHRWLVVAGIPVAALWLILLLLVLAHLFTLLWSPRDLAAAGDPLADRLHYLAIVGMLTALAGLVGFPLALVRLRATERQTVTAEQGHITDRINKAVENLGADKTVNRLGRTVRYTLEDAERSYFEWQDEERSVPDHDAVDGTRKLTPEPWQTHTQTVPNLEVRLGALYALERIAQDSDRDHIQIMEILCAYIRQNAPAPKVDVDPKDAEPPRIDIQTALDIICRRSEKQIEIEQHAHPKNYRLNLRATDLRLCVLRSAKLDRAILTGAFFDRAELKEARLEGTDLNRARLRFAILTRAQLQSANMRGARLDNAILQGANLEKAVLQFTRLISTVLWGADLGRTQLSHTRLDGAQLVRAKTHTTVFFDGSLRGAALSAIDLRRVPTEQLSKAFGNADCILKNGLKPGEDPLEHWCSEKLDLDPFLTAWRQWQAEHHPDLLPDDYEP